MQGVHNEPLATSHDAWKTTNGTIGTAGASVKTSAGRVRLVRVTNKGAAALYFQVHNKATAPVGADASVDRVQVGIGLTAVIDYGMEGAYFATGIGLAASTTADACTLLASNDAVYFAEYI